MENIIIAVDGPAGAGKSTIAKIVADKLNINYNLVIEEQMFMKGWLFYGKYR